MFPRRRPVGRQAAAGGFGTGQLLNQSARSSRRQSLARGLFKNGSWYCECEPELPAQRFQVKKEGANHGRWFYTCQKPKGQGCGFFLWEDDASKRMEAAVFATGAQGEAPTLALDDEQGPPAKRRRLPWEADAAGAETSQGKRKREQGISKADSMEELYEWPDESNEEVLKTFARVAEQAELDSRSGTGQHASQVYPTTPKKQLRTVDNFGTARWEHGLATPSTTHTTKNESSLRSDAMETPIPHRFRDVELESPFTPSNDTDLLSSILKVFSASSPRIEIPAAIRDKLGEVMRQHDARARGYRKGRDKAREAIRARDAKIGQLKIVIQDLEGQIEELRCIQHMNSTGKR